MVARREPHRRTLELEHRYHDDDPVRNAPFTVRLGDGSVRQGTLDRLGRARLLDVPEGDAQVQFGPDAREYELVDHAANPFHRPTLGGFNEQQTTSQILVDAVISMIPLVGDVTAVRDLLAAVLRLAREPAHRSDKTEGMLLVVLLFALVPVQCAGVASRRTVKTTGVTRCLLHIPTPGKQNDVVCPFPVLGPPHPQHGGLRPPARRSP